MTLDGFARIQQMKIEMSGIAVDDRYNKCSIEECHSGAHTAVFGPLPARSQINVCLRHLKIHLESGEWEISTSRRELRRIREEKV